MTEDHRTSTEKDAGDQMAFAVRAMRHHASAAWRTDRTGWTDEQWIQDAAALMDDIDGSVTSLVNGHVGALLRFWEQHRACVTLPAGDDT